MSSKIDNSLAVMVGIFATVILLAFVGEVMARYLGTATVLIADAMKIIGYGGPAGVGIQSVGKAATTALSKYGQKPDGE